MLRSNEHREGVGGPERRASEPKCVTAPLLLRVVHGKPSFRQHANKHVSNVFGPGPLDVSVTPLRAVVTVSEGPAVALKIYRLDGDNRSLDADVLVRRCLLLYT